LLCFRGLLSSSPGCETFFVTYQIANSFLYLAKTYPRHVTYRYIRPLTAACSQMLQSLIAVIFAHVCQPVKRLDDRAHESRTRNKKICFTTREFGATNGI